MYIPRSFQEDDPDTLYDIMRENGFALLISTGGEEPIASHLRITLDIAPDGAASLYVYMAKANQHSTSWRKIPMPWRCFPGRTPMCRRPGTRNRRPSRRGAMSRFTPMETCR